MIHLARVAPLSLAGKRIPIAERLTQTPARQKQNEPDRRPPQMRLQLRRSQDVSCQLCAEYEESERRQDKHGGARRERRSRAARPAEIAAMAQSLPHERARRITVAMRNDQQRRHGERIALRPKPRVKGRLPETIGQEIGTGENVRAPIDRIVGGDFMNFARFLRQGDRCVAQQVDGGANWVRIGVERNDAAIACVPAHIKRQRLPQPSILRYAMRRQHANSRPPRRENSVAPKFRDQRVSFSFDETHKRTRQPGAIYGIVRRMTDQRFDVVRTAAFQRRQNRGQVLLRALNGNDDAYAWFAFQIFPLTQRKAPRA